jgi:hypothetical protein
VISRSEGLAPSPTITPVSDIDGVIEAICRLPRDFEAGNVSERELLARSGYKRVSAEITIDRIANHLSDRPDLVSAWIQLSEDIRSSPNWYIERHSAHHFEVGYYDGGRMHQTSYDEALPACAAFVKRHVESIAESPGFG